MFIWFLLLCLSYLKNPHYTIKYYVKALNNKEDEMQEKIFICNLKAANIDIN